MLAVSIRQVNNSIAVFNAGRFPPIIVCPAAPLIRLPRHGVKRYTISAIPRKPRLRWTRFLLTRPQHVGPLVGFSTITCSIDLSDRGHTARFCSGDRVPDAAFVGSAY